MRSVACEASFDFFPSAQAAGTKRQHVSQVKDRQRARLFPEWNKLIRACHYCLDQWFL